MKLKYDLYMGLKYNGKHHLRMLSPIYLEASNILEKHLKKHMMACKWTPKYIGNKVTWWLVDDKTHD